MACEPYIEAAINTKTSNMYAFQFRAEFQRTRGFIRMKHNARTVRLVS